MNEQTKGYIYANQMALFGQPDIIGFGDSQFCVKEIERNIANKIIIENHYSHKIYSATYIHLGVYINGELVGILQYGYAMNPASQGSLVKDTEIDEYLELNRMWLDDKAPRNSESKAISYSFKYIKRKFNGKIKWVQSFADERCKRFGVVYQACSFKYYGEHTQTFWELNGIVYHNIQMTVSKGTKRYTPEVEYLQTHKDQATKLTLRQFRYLFFIDKKYEKKCLLKELPYPKHKSLETEEGQNDANN